MKARTYEDLTYHQAQQRNSSRFKQLTKAEQNQARSNGYKNRGWDNVINAWQILKVLSTPVAVVSLQSARVARAIANDDIDTAVSLASDLANNLAQQVKELKKDGQQLIAELQFMKI
jgi:hypothetical protein